MAITRGYSFGTSEEVTYDKLHRLVDNAKLSDIGLSDFAGDVRGVVTSTPASGTDGTIMFQHEPGVSLTRPLPFGRVSHPTYLVRSRGEWVALFAGDRLESNRLMLGPDFDPSDNIIKGNCVLAEAIAGSGSATLHAGLDTGAIAKVHTVGVARDTTEYEQNAPLRLTIMGYAAGLAPSNASASPWFDVCFHSGSNKVWTNASYSDASGFNAIRLNNVSSPGDGGTARVQPMYLLGSMCFRE